MGALLAAATLSWSGLARAAELRWGSAGDCHREAEVSEQIESMTKRRLADVESADFELALAALGDGTLRLSLATLPRDGSAPSSRQLEGKSCVDVTDAAAVAIALTIGTPESPVEVAPTPLPRPSPQRENRRPPPPSGASWAWFAGANGVVDSAATPRAVPGGELRFGLGSSRFRLELEGVAFAPSVVRDGGGRGGTFQLLGGAALACLQRSFGAPSALLCGGYELGQLSARGEGVTRAYDRTTFWHAGRVELGFGWKLGQGLSLGARIGAALPIARHAFVLDEPVPIHRPGPLGLRAALGLELQL